MNTMFESIMLMAFIAAVCIMIYRLMQGRSTRVQADRATAVTMGAGFLLGVAGKVQQQSLSAPFFLYLMGAMLCYGAVLFSVPEQKQKKTEGSFHE